MQEAKEYKIVMRSTREKILGILQTKRKATISDLAKVVGINGISVRHHLINLQEEGLIFAEEERHGVGRPRFVYQLTDQGLERFPSNYQKFTKYMLTELKNMLTSEQLTNLFEKIGKNQAQHSLSIDASLPLEEKLELLADQLTADGYRISWKKDGSKMYLYSENCPYHNLGQIHPEICRIDETMFTHALNREIVHSKCISKGEPRCVFILEL